MKFKVNRSELESFVNANFRRAAIPSRCRDRARPSALARSSLSKHSKQLVAYNHVQYFFEPGVRARHQFKKLDKRRPERFAPLLARKVVAQAGPAHKSSIRTRMLMRELGIAWDYGLRRQMQQQPEPKQLIGIQEKKRRFWLTANTMRHWQNMQASAAKDGVQLRLVSAFRSVEYQAGLIRRKIARGINLDDILYVSAAPGYSEHHSGCAIDIVEPDGPVLEAEFALSVAFAWLSKHAVKFHFFLSFPEHNPHQIAFEPWHWCYREKR